MSEFAQTVKQQADIVKVIEGYIRLRKAGAQNYSGLCPFHKEKAHPFPFMPDASSFIASVADSRVTSLPLSKRLRM